MSSHSLIVFLIIFTRIFIISDVLARGGGGYRGGRGGGGYGYRSRGGSSGGGYVFIPFNSGPQYPGVPVGGGNPGVPVGGGYPGVPVSGGYPGPGGGYPGPGGGYPQVNAVYGTAETIAAYLAICDLANRCVSIDQSKAIQQCFTSLVELYPQAAQSLNGCANCCSLDCTPANIQKFVPCFGQKGPTLGANGIPSTAICCFRQNLSLSGIDCLKGLFPNFAMYFANLQG